jgi:hypothetical protein
MIAAAAAGAPGWLAFLDHTVVGWIVGSGQVWPVAVLLLEFGIATTALGGKRTARTGALLGALAAVAIWVIGEGFGQIYTGRATDPNSGPLLLLMASTVFAATSRQESLTPPRPKRRRTGPFVAVRAAAGQRSP